MSNYIVIQECGTTAEEQKYSTQGYTAARTINVSGIFAEIRLEVEYVRWQEIDLVVYPRPSTPIKLPVFSKTLPAVVSTQGKYQEVRAREFTAALDVVSEHAANWITTFVLPLAPSER